jgi:DNA replication protein DnaC
MKALDQLAPVHCPDHPRERFELNREATLKRLMENHVLVLRAEFEHCRACPYVTRDRCAFDKWRHRERAAYKAENGWEFGGDCPASRPVSHKVPDFSASPDKAPRPATYTRESINLDVRPEQQLAAWTSKVVASCDFGRATGTAGSNALPLIGSAIALREQRLDWEGKAELGAFVQNYKVDPAFPSCGGCNAARCGVPPVLEHASFDNFIIDPPAIAQHLGRCREFAAKRAGFLILLGAVGAGKSHLAAAIARESHFRTLFISHDNFLLRHRARYDTARRSGRQSGDEDEQGDILTLARKAWLLIIDDFGRRHAGRDEEALLFSLFNHRYEHQLATVITSNLTRAEFANLLGTALFDRLRHACFSILEFNFPSKRPGLNDDYLKG